MATCWCGGPVEARGAVVRGKPEWWACAWDEDHDLEHPPEGESDERENYA